MAARKTRGERDGEVRGGRLPSRPWLVLVHVVPSVPSNLRVRTWRRLQQLGAVALKQAVYVLPDTPASREDFAWLEADIQAAGGDATVFAAASVGAWSDDRIVEQFRRAREAAYAELVRDLERAGKRAGARGAAPRTLRSTVDDLRGRLEAIERIDFFGAPGRERAAALLGDLDARLTVASEPAAPAGRVLTRAAFSKRVWVTRPRPGVDRMASAWLIRRFIDPHARFAFTAEAKTAPSGAVCFDMFGVPFSHQDGGCTFETLCTRFAIHGAAVGHLAAIVHDLDLKDGRFNPPDAPAIGRVIDGLQRAYEDDGTLLEHGMAVFEGLYRSSARDAGDPRPRHRRRG